MKVTNVKRSESFNWIVTIKYNWLERLFGNRDGDYEFKQTSSYYTFSGQNIYTTKDGTETPNHSQIAEAIDKFKRKW